MHAIEEQFVNQDGTVNYTSAMLAGRKARSTAANDGLEFIGRKISNLIRAVRRPVNAFVMRLLVPSVR